eukprot:CAMPEP_0175011502 /NCGR_PEP_ID=MMETSP0005-20121125/8726_1 /TAXON_ID=420556 /ORGANISM="Ochromonas sp., Strain CCMP1393" /LENGTH=689 /DNA_ID=CAMNT_0016267509 /DNA_START=37 /DNA_END=2106 /DNA_ORIENTATION=-
MLEDNLPLEKFLKYKGGDEEYDDGEDDDLLMNQDDLNGGFDAIESALLRDDMYGNFGASKANLSTNAEFGKKINLNSRVQNDITRSEKKSEKRPNYYGRDDRATSEQVLDPRTRLILFKLLSNGFLGEIDGCLSTGKEANVYYARGSSGIEYAVKIFKTSILVFKDRDRYVSGEHRFRNGYCKSNPRKMVQTWAEKEMRNLKRLCSAGIPAPQPHLLKSHVLVMDFLGKDGWCAPRLKDAHLSSSQYQECYRTIVKDMRHMYMECNLVHGDLSEYNLLWHDNRPVMIDVSQSVELSHPFASEFLRKDVANVTDFFAKKGMVVLSKMSLFQFIVSKSLGLLFGSGGDQAAAPLQKQQQQQQQGGGEKDLAAAAEEANVLMDRVLEHMLARAAEDGEVNDDDDDDEEEEEEDRSQATIAGSIDAPLFSQSMATTSSPTIGNGGTNTPTKTITTNKTTSKTAAAAAAASKEVEEAVFMQAYIPTSLSDLLQGGNPQEELKRLQTGQREPIYASALQGMLAGDNVNTSNSSNINNNSNDHDKDSNNHTSSSSMREKLVQPEPESSEIAAVVGEPSAAKTQNEKDKTGSSRQCDGDNDGDNDDDDGDDDDDDDESGEDGSGDEDGSSYYYSSSDEENRRYRRTLPSHDHAERRQKAKDARKEAKKVAKEAKAEKRKAKIPKHVKKRAVKAGKAK